MRSLSLLQWIFLTQGSNRGFLYCRWILYHLRYQRRPSYDISQFSSVQSLSRVQLFTIPWTAACWASLSRLQVCEQHSWLVIYICVGFPGGSAGKESARNAGDLGSIPGLGTSPGERKGYPLQYSGLEDSMDCIDHGVTKSRTQLSTFHFHIC